ncbi:hypothetical protein ASG19_13860 [Rhizobium sp. Leaf306]|nr:hypothetical protein ASG19_13860 [Rhizobium sp. Leaf306]
MLCEYASVMAGAERLLLARLKAGRVWTGDLKVSFYQPLGLSATHLDMAYRQLMAKLSSVAELAGERAKDLAQKIGSKTTDIARKRKQLRRAALSLAKARQATASLESRIGKQRLALAAAGDKTRDDQLFVLKHLLGQYHASVAATVSLRKQITSRRFGLHQHQRRLAILECKRAKAEEQAKDPSLCFGSSKLFRAQFQLEANGQEDLATWREDWRASRSSQFTLDGNSSKEGGNQFARLRRRADGLFDLELRLPKAITHLATRTFKSAGHDIACIDLRGLSFNHGDAVIRQALESGRPVTVKFRRDKKSWKLSVSVDHAMEAKAADFAGGALGVDLNAGHVSAALLDASGNPVEVFDFPCVSYGRTADRAKDAIRNVAADIAALAARHGVPVVAERLDFARKKKDLKASDPRYARMLSSFAYSAFGQALASACLRRGVALVRVNPAYTSIIGRVKFARRYGLSVHEAASFTIARRAMGYSERLPRSSDGTVTVPTNGCVHVTLDLPVRNGSRHVWSQWNGLNKEYHKKALAALRSSGRRSRPARTTSVTSGGRPPGGAGGTLAGGVDPLHGHTAEAGRSRRKSLQSSGQGVGRMPGIHS